MARRSSATERRKALESRNFDLEMVVAAWEILKARIEKVSPDVEDAGRLAADIIVAKINKIIKREQRQVKTRRRR